MLGISLLFLLAGDLVLAYTATIPFLILGIVLWGLHMGFSQGILATLIADTAPSHLRGTAFGVFSLTTGILALVGNLAAGALWDQQGAQATFLMGALLSGAAIMGLPLLRKYSVKAL
ncbi:MFS transporter [Phyllobacterium brassicacearum]